GHPARPAPAAPGPARHPAPRRSCGPRPGVSPGHPGTDPGPPPARIHLCARWSRSPPQPGRRPEPRHAPATGPQPPAATAAAARSGEATAPRTSTPADREPRARSPYQPIKPQTQNHRVISLRLHRARNVLAKVSKDACAQVKADYWEIFDIPDTMQPGPDAVKFVQARIDAVAQRWRDSYPAAVRCLLADRDSLTACLRFPREHW